MTKHLDPADLATTQLLPYLTVPRNEDAWRAFVHRYRPRILDWCRHLQPDDAEEVTSRVLHKLVIGLARGAYRRQGAGIFRAWLRTVVGNEVVDFARQRHPGQPANADFFCRPDPFSIDELAGELDDQFRQIGEAMPKGSARRVRERVLPHTWEAFDRTHLQGQEAREVAQELGLTLSGVYKARDRVRHLLEEEGQIESLSSS